MGEGVKEPAGKTAWGIVIGALAAGLIAGGGVVFLIMGGASRTAAPAAAAEAAPAPKKASEKNEGLRGWAEKTALRALSEISTAYGIYADWEYTVRVVPGKNGPLGRVLFKADLPNGAEERFTLYAEPK